VAVFIHQGFVWMACNYKVRSIDNVDKLSPDLTYGSFNRLSDRVRQTVEASMTS
jgi:hypothetical protein